jgi:hypothetical protein
MSCCLKPNELIMAVALHLYLLQFKIFTDIYTSWTLPLSYQQLKRLQLST